MTAETHSWQAFNLATEALRSIDQYVASPDRNVLFLQEAQEKLNSALAADSEFARARYFAAVVEDMLGHPKKAAEDLKKLIREKPGFGIEAEYGLAVSRFHLYEMNELNQAIIGFDKVRAEAHDDNLRFMASAGEIRAYGMMVLHSVRANDAAQALTWFNKASELTDLLFDELHHSKSLSPTDLKEIRWRALNGRGVGRMFYSDLLVSSPAQRETELDKALKDISEAQNISSNNWEILCNLGSVHMRVGDCARHMKELDRSQKEFGMARILLLNVVDRVRPEYGFALWEIGRSYRLEGRFDEAISFFERAMKVAEADRNVTDVSVKAEIESARHGVLAMYL